MQQSEKCGLGTKLYSILCVRVCGLEGSDLLLVEAVEVLSLHLVLPLQVLHRSAEEEEGTVGS